MSKINNIKKICETFVDAYKNYPTEIKDIEQALACGMSIAAETILEIINE